MNRAAKIQANLSRDDNYRVVNAQLNNFGQPERALRKNGQSGFTLIELMTVVAIIAILFTLLTTALSSAKKSSHQARCISNLRQIALMVDMYLDDYEKKKPSINGVFSAYYISKPSVLICPADNTGGWGNLVNAQPLVDPNHALNVDANSSLIVPYSYLNPLSWEDWAWEKLIAYGNHAGIAVCQLHGLGRPNLEMPSYRDFQGLVLRAQRDGAVVKRQVFWEEYPVSLSIANPTRSPSESITPPTFGSAEKISSNPDSSNASIAAPPALDYPWRLFSDDTDH